MTDTIKINFEGEAYEVGAEYKWVARDADGEVWAYESRPSTTITTHSWYTVNPNHILLGTRVSDTPWEESLVEITEEIIVKDTQEGGDTLSVFSKVYTEWLDNNTRYLPLVAKTGGVTATVMSEVYFDKEVPYKACWVSVELAGNSICLEVSISYEELYNRLTSCIPPSELTPMLLVQLKSAIRYLIDYMEEDIKKANEVQFDNFKELMR